MQGYYLYLMDAEGHIRHRLDFEALDDQAAIAHAEAHGDGGVMELWFRDRVVATFPRDPA